MNYQSLRQRLSCRSDILSETASVSHGQRVKCLFSPLYHSPPFSSSNTPSNKHKWHSKVISAHSAQKPKDNRKNPQKPRQKPTQRKNTRQSGTYVPHSVRKCEDGGLHDGDIEIVTWDTLHDGQGMGPLGWGACLKDEADDLKPKFEREMKGDLAAVYEYWPQGFRWTCCGLPGDYKWGCDSHFLGCRCDNCRFGYKLPGGFVEQRNKSAHARGLRLGEGNVNGKSVEDSD